ncbi:hypothetical protein J4861_06540 [Prevotella melaninogenica]|uniref:hypothetical protein n=1 Tax=Prevotella melaninogenica TaxID=28132 RepID=UPI001BAD50D4|nr:hypothetical protein [Prevotella melaninogenica]QUB61908.1 hypothetical protein J4861_06540 [Prevotella melaninogenica]
MKKKLFKTCLLSFAAFCGLTFSFASCANEDVAQNPNNTDNDKNLTTFTAGDPSTRTSMESDGKFFWEAGDKIWVKDDDGTWQQSSNAPTAKTDNFKFKVPGTYTAHTSYEVYYPGKNGSQDQVTISANQSQAEPNTTAHFGAAGDCGMATATKVPGKQQFAFTLDHKAAYLLFLPRTSNTVLHKCYLTKVEVNSDNDITDTYTLDPTTGELTGTGTGKQIVLTTKGSGTFANGFPLTNNATSAATNGSYVVIKPGTHILKIRYWVKDVATNVEGTITKTLASATYEQNKYYNITANLNVHDYDGDHYYMWDARKQYWKGHEWWSANKDQPVLNGNSNGNYAQSNADSRYYNTSYPGYGKSNPATHTSCKDLPNANELSWYCMYGDPRWDADELWTTMGHLYKGGMWFKKKSVLQTEHHYDTEKSADGSTDLRTTYKQYRNSNSSIKNSGLPSATDAGNYFYLPALGQYGSGQLYSVGYTGNYWSSSAYPFSSDDAYGLSFGSGIVLVIFGGRDNGYRVGGFE